MRASLFGERKPRDPEWRDLLLTLLDDPKQQMGVLYLLEHFAPDAKIGDVLVRRRFRLIPNTHSD